MIRSICKDEAFLSQRAEATTPADLGTAQDLLDTLIDHRHDCVGMAANMISINKRIIAFEDEGKYTVGEIHRYVQPRHRQKLRPL